MADGKVRPSSVGRKSATRESSNAAGVEIEVKHQVQRAHWCWANRPFLMVLLIYCALSMVTIATDECMSLWALSSKEAGGLDAQPALIGSVFSVTGVSCYLLKSSVVAAS